MYKILWLTFLGFTLISCSKKVRKELTEGEYSVDNFKNDSIKTGKLTIYFKNGVKQRIIKYRENKMVGQMKYYHDNGKIASKAKFKDGFVKDKFYNFHKNGKPYNTYIYLNNKLKKVENCFDGDGNDLDCGSLESGNGFINQYNIDGKLIAIDYLSEGRYLKTDSIN